MSTKYIYIYMYFAIYIYILHSFQSFMEYMPPLLTCISEYLNWEKMLRRHAADRLLPYVTKS